MDLLEKTKEICKLYDIWPSRSKGQNFLIAENIYDKIVEAADLSRDDIVLEVGPGLGFLTAKLAKAAGKVLAVELDDKLAAYLRDAISDGETENVEILNENILDINFKNTKYQSLNTKYKIAANLPYNITSVFLRKFLTSENKPESMVLMLQKEVAERICAKPGDMSLLALSVQFYADPEIIFYVPKESFWPMPAVDSAIIKIKCHSRSAGHPYSHGHSHSICHSREGGNPVKNARGALTGALVKTEAMSEKDFFRLAKFGFSAKRKMLKNNLAGGLHIAPAEAEKMLIAAGLNPKARAEDLSINDWLNLTKRIT